MIRGKLPVPPRAIGYARVSTTDQVEFGASIAAQRAMLETEASRRGWKLRMVSEQGSAKDLNRPQLQSVLQALDRQEAHYLLATRLDRISRSVSDFASLLDRSVRRGWGLVLLSPNLDTADPAGRFTANILASASQYERELIGLRTREGMAQRKAEGVHVGRPRALPNHLYERVLQLHESGQSYAEISDRLGAEGIKTATGSAIWHPSTIRRMVASQLKLRAPA